MTCDAKWSLPANWRNDTKWTWFSFRQGCDSDWVVHGFSPAVFGCPTKLREKQYIPAGNRKRASFRWYAQRLIKPRLRPTTTRSMNIPQNRLAAHLCFGRLPPRHLRPLETEGFLARDAARIWFILANLSLKWQRRRGRRATVRDERHRVSRPVCDDRHT